MVSISIHVPITISTDSATAGMVSGEPRGGGLGLTDPGYVEPIPLHWSEPSTPGQRDDSGVERDPEDKWWKKPDLPPPKENPYDTPNPENDGARGALDPGFWRTLRERGISTRPGVSDPQWTGESREGRVVRLAAEFIDLLVGGGVTDPVPYGDERHRAGRRSGGVGIVPRGPKSDDPKVF